MAKEHHEHILLKHPSKSAMEEHSINSDHCVRSRIPDLWIILLWRIVRLISIPTMWTGRMTSVQASHANLSSPPRRNTGCDHKYMMWFSRWLCTLPYSEHKCWANILFDCFCNSLLLHLPWFLLLPLIPVIPIWPLPRSYINFPLPLSSCGTQPALFCAQPGYCYVCSHWLSLSPLETMITLPWFSHSFLPGWILCAQFTQLTNHFSSFLPGLLCHPEDKGNMFPQTSGSLAVLQPRRCILHSHCFENLKTNTENSSAHTHYSAVNTAHKRLNGHELDTYCSSTP
jgi:hypothetical protein